MPTDEPPKVPPPQNVVAALVRREGRIRVTPRELAEASRGRLDAKVDEDGTVMLQWRERGADG